MEGVVFCLILASSGRKTGWDLQSMWTDKGRCSARLLRIQKGSGAKSPLVSCILTFLISSEVIGFPFLSIAPSATMMMLRREPRVLVWSGMKNKISQKMKLMDG